MSDLALVDPAPLTNPEFYRGIIESAKTERRLRDVALKNHVALDTLKHWLKLGTSRDAPPILARFARDFAEADIELQRRSIEEAENDMEIVLKDVPAKLAVEVFPEHDRSPVARLARKLAELQKPGGKPFLMSVKRKGQAREKWRFVRQRWPIRDGDDDLMDLFQQSSKGSNVWRLLTNPTPRFAEVLKRLFTEAPAPIVALLEASGWRRAE